MLLYGTNTLRNALLGVNPDMGQATVIGSLSGDLDLATGTLSQLFALAWSLDGRTLYAQAFAIAAASARSVGTPWTPTPARPVGRVGWQLVRYRSPENGRSGTLWPSRSGHAPNHSHVRYLRPVL